MNIDPSPSGPAGRPAALEALRAAVRRLERCERSVSVSAITLGVPVLDNALPDGGIARGRLHEILAGDILGTTAAGFAALLLGRLSAPTGWVAWCRQARRHDTRLHPQGLSALGLSSERLAVVRTGDPTATLWAAEECLRSGSLDAVLIEIAAPAPAALRRLQLAAEHGGSAAFLLRPLGAVPLPATALTAWKISAASSGTATPHWQIELTRARGGKPGAWLMEWIGPEGDGNDEASGLRLVADLRDRLGEAENTDGAARRIRG